MNKKIISEKIIYALKELKANGITICIATGRTPMTIMEPHIISLMKTTLHLMAITYLK